MSRAFCFRGACFHAPRCSSPCSCYAAFHAATLRAEFATLGTSSPYQLASVVAPCLPPRAPCLHESCPDERLSLSKRPSVAAEWHPIVRFAHASSTEWRRTSANGCQSGSYRSGKWCRCWSFAYQYRRPESKAGKALAEPRWLCLTRSRALTLLWPERIDSGRGIGRLRWGSLSSTGQDVRRD